MEITLCMILDALMEAHPDMIVGNYHSCPVQGIKLLPMNKQSRSPGYLSVGWRKGRAVLVCGEGKDLALESDIGFEELFNELQESYTTLRNWDMEMHMLMLRGGGLDEILDISSEVLKNPITIMNPGFRLLAHTRKVQSRSQIYNYVLEHGCLPERIIGRHEKAGIFPKIEENGAVRLIADAQDHVTAIGPLYVEQRIVGQMTMPCTERVYSEGLAEQFKALISNVELIFKNDIQNRTMNQYMHEYFLMDLIEGGQPEGEDFAERLKYVGLPAEGRFTLLTIRQGRHEPYLNEYHATRLAELLPDERTFSFRKELCLLLNGEKHAGGDYLQHALDKLQGFFVKEGLLCGVSAEFGALAGLPGAYHQTQAALDLGTRVGEGRLLEKLKITSAEYPSEVFLYNQYLLHRMVDCCAQQSTLPPQEALKSLCEPRLLALIETDRSEGSNHCEVLYCFLLLERRISETAAFLHMHRNSVIYRIGRIEEMLGADLGDAGLRSRLMISFAAAELMV